MHRGPGEHSRTFFKPEPVRLASLRIRLGQSMVVGLEFQVAADSLKTGLSPTSNSPRGADSRSFPHCPDSSFTISFYTGS